MCSKEFHNKIAELCIKHFNTLPVTGKPKIKVVALGTGSKCIGKSKMCSKGTILNDSHAEIVCRRAFLRFLYDQMISEGPVLLYNLISQKFRVKSGIKFHFFTTHVPCGDAAIFLRQNNEDFGSLLHVNESMGDMTVPDKKRKLFDGFEEIFQTGAKCLEISNNSSERGTSSNVLGVVRTKPGRGDQTLSVSCSDKIAKWCHLGIQGALLSFLMEEPIYLSTFTLTGRVPYDINALERAFYTRLENSSEMPFTACKMQIGQAETPFSFCKSEEKKPCSSSISWIKSKSERPLEVSVDGRRQGVTKKNIYKDSAVLRISKLKLFQSFGNTIKKFNIKLPNGKALESLRYLEAKCFSKEYQDRWKILMKGFGVWTIKDPSYLQFCCE